MKSIRINPWKLSADGLRIEADIWVGSEKFELYYQSDSTKIQPRAEAFISATILIAMKQRINRIEIDEPVSRTFLSGIEEIQNVFQSWKPNYGRVEIQHAGFKEEESAGQKTGVFFSAGVDSYHSYLSNRNEIDALIYLDGFDIPLAHQGMRERMKTNIKKISDRFDLPAVIIETNARQFQEKFITWGFSHGSAIASAGHLLAGEFSRFLLASGGNPRAHKRYGVHPDLDSNWGSDRLHFEHDSYNVDRIEKCRFISQFQPVHDTLRVCLRSPESSLNCGVCEKCLRTMVYFQSTGDYEKYTVFEKPLDTEILKKYKRISAPDKDLLYRALDLMEAEDAYPETVQVLKKILFPAEWWKRLIVGGRKIRKKLL